MAFTCACGEVMRLVRVGAIRGGIRKTYSVYGKYTQILFCILSLYMYSIGNRQAFVVLMVTRPIDLLSNSDLQIVAVCLENMASQILQPGHPCPSQDHPLHPKGRMP